MSDSPDEGKRLEDESTDLMLDLFANSSFGAHTGRPFVTFGSRRQDFMLNLAPDEARKVALWLLECAENAEVDGCVLLFFKERLGVSDPESQVRILQDFRGFREAWQKGQVPK